MTKKKRDKATAGDTIANELIAELERGGVVPWIQPWSGAVGMPTSLATGKGYSGINILALWGATQVHAFGSAYWTTYANAVRMGGHVRRGQHGTKIIAVSVAEEPEADVDGEESRQRRLFTRALTVFNVEQCEGVPEPDGPAPIPDEERDAVLDEWVAATGADIVHRGTRACYRPREDRIEMPRRERFNDAANYYSTILHELVHWTGHESRLAREQRGATDGSYAREELVAEMGAAFLCAEYGVPGELQHARYLSHWVRALQADPKLLLRSASAAQKAVDWLRAHQKPVAATEAA